MGLADENPKGTMRIAVETPLLVLACVAVALRFWARKIKHRDWEFNDYAMLIALFFSFSTYVNVVIEVVNGGRGQHTAHLLATDPDKLVRGAKAGFAATLLWCPAITFIKLSILHLYLTIFPNIIFRRIVYSFMAVCALYGTAFIASSFALCPIKANWSEATDGVKCNAKAGYLISGIINLVLDIITVAMPMPLVWGLQMRRSRKIAITAMFSLGISICILTAVRLKLTVDLDFDDLSYSVMDFAMLSALELYLGCTNACLPLLSPVISLITKDRKFALFSNSFLWARRSTRRLLSKELTNTNSVKQRNTSRSNSSSRQHLDNRDDTRFPLRDTHEFPSSMTEGHSFTAKTTMTSTKNSDW